MDGLKTIGVAEYNDLVAAREKLAVLEKDARLLGGLFKTVMDRLGLGVLFKGGEKKVSQMKVMGLLGHAVGQAFNGGLDDLKPVLMGDDVKQALERVGAYGGE